MKKFLISLLALSTLIAFQGCEEPNELIFVASPDGDGVVITTTFSDVYLLSLETADNVAERIVWNEVDLGVETNVTYEFYGALESDFSDSVLVGSTSSNNIALSVDQLLDFARDLGLDSDPATTDADGNPNNTGTVYFRVKAFPGAGTGNSMIMVSDLFSMDIEWIEIQPVGGGCDPIWVVGAGAADAGWDWATPVEFTCEDNVYSAKIKLVNDAFRFFLSEGDWASGQNYPYYAGEGYTIDPLFEDAQDGDNNFQFVGDPGVYLLTVDDVNKTITLEETPLWLVGAATPGGWDWAAPTKAPEVEVGVWQTNFDIANETFRFFTVRDDWGSGLNYPYYLGEGYTIDADFEDALDGDNNFRYIGAPGNVTVTLNTNDQTIVVE